MPCRPSSKPDNTKDPAVVGAMFSRICPAYDRLNHILSFGMDFYWRNQAALALAAYTPAHIVDIATGSGDQMTSLFKHCPRAEQITGIDISGEMLTVCRKKLTQKGLVQKAILRQEDITQTDLPEASFDAAAMSFGIRNVADIDTALQQIHRILKPGGLAVILEFSMPKNPIIRAAFLFYLRFLVPVIGGLLSGNFKAYRYLNKSIEHFDPPNVFIKRLQNAGFTNIRHTPMTLNTVHLYLAMK